MTEALDTIEVVYLGKRMVKGDKVAHAFILPDRLESLLAENEGYRFSLQDVTEKIERESSLYVIKGTGPASIGGIYGTQGLVEGGSIQRMVPTKLAWKRSVSGTPATYLPAWRTLHDAVELEKRRKSAEKNAFADKDFMRALDTLKDRYRKIPAGYKRGFMLWLQDELGKR